MQKWDGKGEPPPPRRVYHNTTVELHEIPLDCDLEILGTAYRLVHRATKKRSWKPEEIFAQVVFQHPQIRFPEVRECAKLLGFEASWAQGRWCLILAARLTLCQTWAEVEALMATNLAYKQGIWNVLTPDERTRIKALKQVGIPLKVEHLERQPCPTNANTLVEVDWDGSPHHGKKGQIVEIDGNEIGIQVEGIPWLLYFPPSRLKLYSP